MTHIDEGTIHAWLDGAVDATQAREIEAHVAQCATCSAAVAEARGLVAGASRILNALDDVPAGVTPKRRAAPRRQWRAAPWVTGIAAALVLGIGVSQWNREQGQFASSDTFEARSAPVAADVAPRESVSQATALAAAVSPPPAAPAPRRAAESRGPQIAASQVRRDTSEAGKDERIADAAGAGGVAAGVAEGAKSVAAADKKEMKLELVTITPLRAKELLKDTPSAAPPTSQQSELRRRLSEPVQLKGMVTTGAIAKVDEYDASSFVGCYRVAAVSQLSGILSNVGEATRAAKPKASPSASADYVVPRTSAVFQLDTVRGPLGYVVRSAASDSTIGFWRQIARDSARVDLRTAGTFDFARRNRINCPER